MSIKQNQGFLLQSPVPTVLRDAVDTIVDLKNINDNYYPNNYIVLCNEDNTVYLYTKSNSIDATTGKCRKLVPPETPFDAFPNESNTSAVYSDGLYKWFKGYGDWDLGKTYTYKTPNDTRAPLVKRYDHKNVTSPTQESLFVTYEATYTPYLSKTIHYDCTGTRNQDYYAVFCAPHSSAGAIKFDFTTKTLSGSSTDPDWSAGNSITCMFDTNHDRVSFASLPKGFDIIASSVVGDEYTIAMKIPASYVGHLYFRTSGYFNDTNSTNALTFMRASVLNDSVTWSFTYYKNLVDNLTTYDIVTYEQLQKIPSFGTGSSILNYSLINSEHINIIEENTGSNSKTFNWAMDKAIYCSLLDKFTFLDTSKQPTLVAGNNITITNGNVISASVEVEGSVEMASSTADVLKEKTLYFIKNGNVYDGYKLGEYETSISNVYEETTDIGVGTDESASSEIKCLDGVLFGYKKPYNTRPKLMKSYDLGATWEEIQVGLITKGIRFYILNGQIVVLGITADDTKKLYVSTDLGITWTEKTPPPSSFFENPAVYYKGKYYTISNGNVLDSSSDLVTWESVTTEFTPNNWGLYTFKDLIIAISSSGYGYWSEDGETWTRFTFTNFSGGYSSYPSVSDGNIIIIKCPYAWLKSYDGKTWIETSAGSGGFNYLESAAYNGSVWLVRMANSGQVESRTLIGSNFDNLSIIENNFPYHNTASLIPIENSFIAAYSRTNNTYVYKIDLSKSPMKVVNGFDYDRYYTKSEIDEKIPTQEQIVGWNDHVQDGDIHVTTEEKELWNLVSDDSYHNIVPINFNTLRKMNVTPGVVYYYDYTTKKDRIYKFKNLWIPTTNAVILKLLDSNNNVLQSITSGLNSNEEISVVSNQDSQKISIETDYTNFAVTVTEYTNYKYLPRYMSVEGSYQLFTPAEGTTSIAYTFRKDGYYLIKNTSETARFNMQVNGVYLTYSIYPNTQIVCKMPVSGNSATLFTTGAGCELTIEEVLLPWEELKKFINQTQYTDPTKILYEKKFTDMSEMSEFDINQGTLTTNGYQLSSGQVLKLNKYYSLGYRTVKYLVKFGSSGGTAKFKSNSGDTIISVDYTNGTFNLNGLSLVSIPNFDNSHQYLIAITKNYQDQIVSVTDVYTGATTSHTYTRNGTGGKGQGAVGTEIITGMQYDYYMMTVTSGSDQILLKKIIVEAGKYDLFLTMYGDSITEPEGYYPTVDFSKAWTQLFVANCAGKAICSGRGGTTINQIMTRISNELPFIRSKYVMITIGTNGGNTYENLCELVEYIQSLGSTAILNHIPCNESGTQVAVNAVIDQVRARYGIKGVDFDKATSLAEDGVTVDTDKMWWENISESQNIYHHPNVLGSAAMYALARIDCPELFNS